MALGVELFAVKRALALGAASGALLLALACESNSTSIDDPSSGGSGASPSGAGTSGSSTAGGSSGAADSGGAASGATDAGGAPAGEEGGGASGGSAGGALPVGGAGANAGGGGEPAGEGGGSGTEGAECESDNDCAVFNDCCTCAALPAKNLPGECERLCIQSACAARGLEGVPAVCSGKRCVFGLHCDGSLVTCKLAKPTCEDGMIPSVIEPCWGPCIAPDECSAVTDLP